MFTGTVLSRQLMYELTYYDNINISKIMVIVIFVCSLLLFVNLMHKMHNNNMESGPRLL